MAITEFDSQLGRYEPSSPSPQELHGSALPGRFVPSKAECEIASAFERSSDAEAASSSSTPPQASCTTVASFHALADLPTSENVVSSVKG